MPTFKKPRSKGTTYKLVPRSYGDTDGVAAPVWVSEAEFYRSHQNPTAAEEEEKAQWQFRMYAAAANAEFREEGHQHHRAEAAEDEGEYYDYDEEIEGDSVDGEGVEDEEEEEREEQEVNTTATATANTATRNTVSFALPSATSPSTAPPARSASAAAAAAPQLTRWAKHVRHGDGEAAEDGHESDAPDRTSNDAEEGDKKLFDDEVECEVTDEFLRQLVFGGDSDGAAGEGDEEDFMNDDDDGGDDDWDGLDQEDGEMWRLLTEEEKAAIKASRHRGTARRRKVAAGSAAATRTHAADGTEYPTHDVTQRALDRQFTEMMREFNADARLNDAYTDDPRTHGALPMEKYMTALEEFVMDRAGMDVETAEPHKNKGLIQQLKYLSHQAGAFDSDSRGTYMTTLLPEKQQRFVDEFQKGSEEIRRAARMRLAQRRQQAAAATALIPTPSPATSSDAAAAVPAGAQLLGEDEEKEEEEEEMTVVEVKSKADRLDCETAVSAYSTYYNQPNVIQAPRRSNPARRTKKTVGMVSGNVISAEAADKTTRHGDTTSAANSAEKKTKTAAAAQPRNASDEEDALATIPTVRRKDETKEEKRLRRQAVKAAQRERRQAKSALKSMYKTVESEEAKRSAASQAARRTVHFM